MVWLQQDFGESLMALGCGWVNSVFIGMGLRYWEKEAFLIIRFQPFKRYLLRQTVNVYEINSWCQLLRWDLHGILIGRCLRFATY